MESLFKRIRSLMSRTNPSRSVNPRKDEAYPWADVTNSIGWSPSMSAAYHGSVVMIKLLLNTGSPIRDLTAGGHSVMMVAALCGQDAVLRILADNSGIKDEQPDRLGYTLLHFASAKCSLKAVQLLVELGADVNGFSLLGATPLSVAEASSRPEIAEYLRNVGAEEGDPDADAKFNLARSAMAPYYYNVDSIIQDVMSFQNAALSISEIEASVLPTIGVHVFESWNENYRDVAMLDEAFKRHKIGMPSEEVYAPFSFGFGYDIVPYLVFRKGDLFIQAPVYLETLTYVEYLAEILHLIESGVECIPVRRARGVWN